MNRDNVALIDIVKAGRMVLDFKQDMDKESFLNDPKTQSAILHQLMIIGEAVKRLTNEFRTQYSYIPWSLIAGMRDNLIHAYDAVDLDEVWKTVTVDIPDLLDKIEPIAPKNPTS